MDAYVAQNDYLVELDNQVGNLFFCNMIYFLPAYLRFAKHDMSAEFCITYRIVNYVS